MDKTPLLVIVGLGNIGYRHLQSLIFGSKERRFHCILIDPVQLSQERAKSLCAETGIRVDVYSCIQEFRPQRPPDLVVSAVRANEQRELLPFVKSLEPRRLLIEKPFLQSLEDLEFFNDLSDAKHTRTHVNLSRRMWPGYIGIRDLLKNEKHPLSIRVSGQGWGLGCNSLHFVDLFSWMTEAPDIHLLESRLFRSRFPNKRGELFEEFAGSFVCESSRGDHLEVLCTDSDGQAPTLRIELSSGAHFFEIDEIAMTSVKPKGDFGFLHISQSTGLWFFSDQQSFLLPSLREALPSQVILLEALKASFPGKDRFHIT